MREASLQLDGPDRLRDLRAAYGGAHPAAAELAELLDARGVLTADVPDLGADIALLQDAAQRLSDCCTALVAAEPAVPALGFAPTHRAAVLRAAGARVVAEATCRDRNRVALEGELAAFADLGVAGVVVRRGHDAGAGGVFDLDVDQLATLAHRAGHLPIATATVDDDADDAAAVAAAGACAATLAAAAGDGACLLRASGRRVDVFADTLRTRGLAPRLIVVVPVWGERATETAVSLLRHARVHGVHLDATRHRSADGRQALERIETVAHAVRGLS